MLTVIEIISGQIIILLECTGELTAKEVRDNLFEPQALIEQSLEWLLKEDYVTETAGKYKIKYPEGIRKDEGTLALTSLK
jgi:hypothetical protein